MRPACAVDLQAGKCGSQCEYAWFSRNIIIVADQCSTMVLVQDGTSMEIRSADCTCVDRWL